jgi:hypothetical protein
VNLLDCVIYGNQTCMLDMAETDDDKTVSWIRLSDENGTHVRPYQYVHGGLLLLDQCLSPFHIESRPG